MGETKRPPSATQPDKKITPDRGEPAVKWETTLDPNETVRMDRGHKAPATLEMDAVKTLPAGGQGSASPAAPVSAPRSTGRSVELIVVDEAQVPGSERKGWRAAEVWTKRRVYGLDSTFRCVEVLERETGRPEPGNDMIGARLGGGRLREPDKVRFSYPLPLPGMEAMFMKGKKHGYTSAVERMIVRIRVLHTSPEEAIPSWDEIASRWSEPPPR